MKIEYLEKFRKMEEENAGNISGMLRMRRSMCREYSFAVPSEEAVLELVSMSPLVEVGAGSGYWAMLVREAGGEIHAFDKSPGRGNKYAFTKSHGSVLEGDESLLENIDTRFNLFLCWPNYDTDFAYSCLSKFRGRRVAYAGEGEGGCTANGRFFELLQNEWELLKTIPIPQWPGMHDGFGIYERRKAPVFPPRPGAVFSPVTTPAGGLAFPPS